MNSHKREIPITIGGLTRTMTPTLEAVVNLEDDLGRGLLDVLLQAKNPMRDGTNLKMRDVAKIIMWGLWGAGHRTHETKGILGTKVEPLTLDLVLAWVWEEREAKRYPQINALAYGFVAMALNVDDPDPSEGGASGK